MTDLRLYSVVKNSIISISFLLLSQLAIADEAHLNTPTIHDVSIITSMGNIEIELYPEQAPITVANFVKYIKAGAYNDGRFYRVVRLDNDNGSPKIQVIQAGASPQFSDFQPIQLENTEQTKIKHLDGVLSMARGTPNSATSEFFICVGEQPSLDFGGKRNPDGLGFAAFGRVVKGMEIVKMILNITDTLEVEDNYVKDQMLKDPVAINRVLMK